jgi:hypothetical protein
MKVVTLEIEDELYEDFKLFRDGYLTSVKHREGKHPPQSPQRRVNWQDINLSQLMVERPDLVAAIVEAKGNWARAVCDVVKAVESLQENSSTPTVHLKNETRDEWLTRQGLRKTGCLAIFMAFVVVVMTAGVWLCR